ncbi:hypothetical protein ACFZAU_20085 [Streptomyces sp. NPDC008238]
MERSKSSADCRRPSERLRGGTSWVHPLAPVLDAIAARQAWCRLPFDMRRPPTEGAKCIHENTGYQGRYINVAPGGRIADMKKKALVVFHGDGAIFANPGEFNDVTSSFKAL